MLGSVLGVQDIGEQDRQGPSLIELTVPCVAGGNTHLILEPQIN